MRQHRAVFAVTLPPAFDHTSQIRSMKTEKCMSYAGGCNIEMDGRNAEGFSLYDLKLHIGGRRLPARHKLSPNTVK
jgi:hypothetical protein